MAMKTVLSIDETFNSIVRPDLYSANQADFLMSCLIDVILAKTY